MTSLCGCTHYCNSLLARSGRGRGEEERRDSFFFSPAFVCIGWAHHLLLSVSPAARLTCCSPSAFVLQPTFIYCPVFSNCLLFSLRSQPNFALFLLLHWYQCSDKPISKVWQWEATLGRSLGEPPVDDIQVSLPLLPPSDVLLLAQTGSRRPKILIRATLAAVRCAACSCI